MKRLIILVLLLLGSISLSYAASSEQFIPVVTDNHGNTLSASETASNSGGFSFKALDNILLRNISIEPTATPTRALLRYDNGTTITTASISGNYAVFNYELEKDVTYRLEADASGGSYSMKRNDAPTFPTKTNIQYISASKDGVDDGDGFLRNIVGVNSQELLYFNSSDFNVTNVNFSASDSHIQDYLFSGEEFIESSRNDGTINGVTYNDGTLTNFASTVRTNDCINETFGNCLEFDGINDHIIIPDDATLDMTTEMTISLWINSSNKIFNDGIIGKRWSGETASWFVNTNADGTINWHVWDGGGVERTIASSTDILDGEWHNLMLFVNSTHQYIYTDGSLDSTVSTITGIQSGNSRVSLGTYFSAGEVFTGSLDEVRIFDFALNSSQIQAEMNSRNPVETPVASYPFEETQGVTAFDLHTFVQGNNSESKWNKAFSFDGANDEIALGDINLNPSEYTFSLWSKHKVAIDEELLYTNAEYIIRAESDGAYTCFNNAVFDSAVTNTNPINEWVHVVCSFNGSHITAYANGVLGTSTPSSAFTPTANSLLIGRTLFAPWFTGSLDELKIFNRSLNSTEIQQLANNNYYNTSGLVFESNFEQLTNTQINDRQVDLCYNCSSTTATNTRTDGVYTAWYTDAQDGTSKFTFLTVDTVNPNLQNDLPTELNNNNKTLNLSSVITFNDSLSGIDTCLIEFNNTQTANCTDTFTFNTAGIFTYDITATDNAGNTNTTSSQIYVNPYHQFFFLDNLNNSLTNLTLGGRSDNGTGVVRFLTFNDNISLGDNNLTFIKSGYATQTISFNANITQAVNNNYSINDAEIIVTIRDKATGDIVSGPLFQLEFIATVGLLTNTSTGTKTVTNTLFLNESYQLKVSSDNYTTENVYFNFNNQESLPITVYVGNESEASTGFVQIKVVDKFGKSVVGASVEALQWDVNTSSYIKVSEGITVEDGTSILNIILDDKEYIFRATFGDLTKDTVSQSIPTLLNGKVITISLDEGPTEFEGFLENVDFTINETFVNNVSNISIAWINRDGLDTTACIYYYRIFPSGQTTELSEDCSTSSDGVLMVSKSLNSTFRIEARVGFEVDSLFYNQKTYLYPAKFDISKTLEETNLALFILPLLYLVVVLVGMANIFIGAVLLILVNGLGLWLVPQFITPATVAFFYFVGLLLMWVGGRRK